MATHDYIISNASGASVRADLNNALAAIVSNNSNATSPATTYAYQWWADTTTGQLKLRNSANSAWITIFELDGTMLMEDGTVSAPGLAFASDLNTGFFRSAADKINFATGGAERLEIGSSEVVFNDPSNDVDFRVESNGNANMLFVNAGTDRVGIGTATPAGNLQISGSGDQSVLITGGTSGTTSLQMGDSDDADVGAILYDNSNNSMQFKSNASERLRIDNSGRLLVGTTTSIAASNQNNRLQLFGTTQASGRMAIFRSSDDTGGSGIHLCKSRGTAGDVVVNNGDQVGIIAFNPYDGGDFQRQCANIEVNIDGTPGTDDVPGRITFATTADGASSPTERLRIDSSGNVGIGTTSASDDIHLKRTSSDAIIRIENTGNGNHSGIFFVRESSDGTSKGAANIHVESNTSNSAAALVFGCGSNILATGTERMRITSEGRVGIGTTDPGSFFTGADQLVVSGGSGDGGITIDSGTSSFGRLLFADGTTGVNGYRGFLTYNHSTNNLLFGSDGTERMRLNSSGQMLHGITSATSVLGNGVGIKSGAVGSNFNEGALSLTGTGGDFYGLTFSKSGNNNAEGFGFLAVFSGATDSLQIGYNSGSSNQGILTCYQNGNVFIQGALSKGSGSFKIDHPLPAKTETHDLVHSFIEGPQADLIYRGKVDLVAGAATVNLDTAARMTEGTFVLLNTNVQCFTTNESDWTAVRGSVSGNTLTIAAEDNTSTATVSWMVIGERQDQHMLDTDWTDDNGRVITEPEKPS